MRRGHLCPVRAQGGYVLVATLALLAVLAVIAGRLHESVAHFQTQTGNWQAWGEAQVELASARDEVLYFMLRHQLSEWGFGVGPQALRVDGRVYRLPSGVRVSVQDERGLIGLNTFDPEQMRQFLRGRGVDAAEFDRLIDTLDDYTDLDDFRRASGAEKEMYAAAGLPEPRNDFLVSPFELGRVLRWRDLGWMQPRPSDFFSAHREPWINVNTAPPEVLRAFTFSDVSVKRAMERRELQPFANAGELAMVSGIVLAEDEVFNFYPGLFYRVRLWMPEQLPALESHIMLTPGWRGAPYRVLEARYVSRDKLSQENDEIPLFPTSAQAWLPAVDVAE